MFIEKIVRPYVVWFASVVFVCHVYTVGEAEAVLDVNHVCNSVLFLTHDELLHRWTNRTRVDGATLCEVKQQEKTKNDTNY